MNTIAPIILHPGGLSILRDVLCAGKAAENLPYLRTQRRVLSMTAAKKTAEVVEIREQMLHWKQLLFGLAEYANLLAVLSKLLSDVPDWSA